MNKLFILETYNRDQITVVAKDRDRAWEMIETFCKNFPEAYGENALSLSSKKDLDEIDLQEEHIW